MNYPLASKNHSIRFKKCFNSFNSINNKNMLYLLHQNLRDIPNKIINSDKLFLKRLKITQLKDKLK